VEVVGSSPIKGPVVSLGKIFYLFYFVLVGSRNGFEHNFTIELIHFDGIMEDCPIVKYRQNQNQIIASMYPNYNTKVLVCN